MRNPAAKFYVTSIPGLQSALSGADQPHNDPGEFKCALCEGTGTMPGSDELEAEVTEQTNGCNGCQGTGRYAQPCHSILSISNNKWIPAAIVTPDGEWHDRVDDWDQRVRALLEQHRDAIAVVVVCTARDTINQSEDREFEYLKAFFKRVVRNPDNRYLEPVAAGPFTVGFVDEVNGPGATEVPEFNPTRHELIELVKYWKKTALDSEYWVFLAAQIGSRDMRVQPYAYRRVSRIADLLGEEEIQKVVDEVENEFGKSQDPRTWEIFLHGTEEEREQLQLEIQRGLDEPDDNESLPQKRSPEAPDGE